MRGVVEEVEVLNGGGLGEEENRVSAVSCGGGQDGAKMGASGQTSSLYGWVMWVASKSLERNTMRVTNMLEYSKITYADRPQIRRKSDGTHRGTISW